MEVLIDPLQFRPLLISERVGVGVIVAGAERHAIGPCFGCHRLVITSSSSSSSTSADLASDGYCGRCRCRRLLLLNGVIGLAESCLVCGASCAVVVGVGPGNRGQLVGAEFRVDDRCHWVI